jgi:hypothetical protein
MVLATVVVGQDSCSTAQGLLVAAAAPATGGTGSSSGGRQFL